MTKRERETEKGGERAGMTKGERTRERGEVTKGEREGMTLSLIHI